MAAKVAAPSPEALARSAYGPATGVMTDEDGLIPIEWLQIGHHVVTHEGLAGVLWTGTTPVFDLAEGGDSVVIAPDALGDASPGVPVTVGPKHLVLVRHPGVVLHFAEEAVFVEARDLLGINGITRARPASGAIFVHVVLERPVLIETQGLWSSTLDPQGDVAKVPVLHEGEAAVLRDVLAREWAEQRQSA
ncbi:MAG: Hint domain-containing protein [Pseudomonadota bacterium]